MLSPLQRLRQEEAPQEPSKQPRKFFLGSTEPKLENTMGLAPLLTPLPLTAAVSKPSIV